MMKEQDKIIVEKLVKVLNANLYSVIEEFEKMTDLPFEVGCSEDLNTLLNMMHGAVDLIVPVMNEAKKEVECAEECIFIQE